MYLSTMGKIMIFCGKDLSTIWENNLDDDLSTLGIILISCALMSNGKCNLDDVNLLLLPITSYHLDGVSFSH